MNKSKYIHFFGDQTAEGGVEKKHLLGGKGANLIEMTRLGISVPPGFVITTEVCDLFFKNNKKLPKKIKQEIEHNLEKLENASRAKFGGVKNPLLVAARSGAMVSMPGMMDSILNIGMNESIIDVISKTTSNLYFAWDTYRRFIQMYSDVVKKIPPNNFEEALLKIAKPLNKHTEIKNIINLVSEYKKIYKKYTKTDFPSCAREQLWDAIDAVFCSWNNDRAVEYRKRKNINGLIGTAVIVQAMVFGNLGDNSGTGVYFTRDPLNGVKEPYGEYLINAQGEDVVAGIIDPEPIHSLKKVNREIYSQLINYGKILEKHFKDMQDIEFTFQKGKLYILQTRSGRRTESAAKKITADMVEEGIIN